MLSPKLSNWLEQAMQMDLPMLREAYKTLLELYGGVCSEKEETAATHPYYYFKYLLEQVPLHEDGRSLKSPEELIPPLLPELQSRTGGH